MMLSKKPPRALKKFVGINFNKSGTWNEEMIKTQRL